MSDTHDFFYSLSDASQPHTKNTREILRTTDIESQGEDIIVGVGLPR